MCEICGQVRECDRPLLCARGVYHAGLPAMVELTEEVTPKLGDAPHPLVGRTAADKGYAWLGDLGPDSVVLADDRR